MRITGCHIKGFGQIEHASMNLDQSLLVVHGDNEAGKTTLFQFLVSMLFGFSPASRDRHPYAPQSPDHPLGGRLDFRLDAGNHGQIDRRLGVQPKSTMKTGVGLFQESSSDLRNHPVPFAKHVSRRVFESLYAITLADLAALDDDTWEDVADRLLTRIGGESLRSPRDVADELEKEANSLWRPDKRGKPVATRHQAKLKELAIFLLQARDRDNRARSLARAIDEVNADIVQRRATNDALRRTAERLQRIQRARARIDDLDRRAGDQSQLERLPADPAGHVRSLESEFTRVNHALTPVQHALAGARRDITAATDVDRRTQGHDPEIRALEAQRDMVTRAEESVSRWDNPAEASIRTRLDEASTKVIGRTMNDFEVLDLGDVGSLYDDLTGLADASALLEAARRPPATSDARHALLLSTLLLVAGCTLSVLSVWIRAMTPAGVLLMVVGMVATAIQLRRRSSHRKAHLGALDRATQNVDTLYERVQTRIRGSVLQHFALGALVTNRLEIGRLTDLASQAAPLVQRVEEERTVIARVKTEVDALAARLGLSLTGVTCSESIEMLVTIRAAAEERISRADAASNSLPELTADEQKLENERASLNQQIQRIRSEVTGISGLSFDSACAKLADRRRARSAAIELRATLESEYPDWREVANKQRELHGTLENAVSAIGSELSASEALLRKSSESFGSMTNERDRIAKLPTPADIVGEMRAEEDSLLQVWRRRDRLMLMAAIVRRADIRFREKHQSDVIRRAGTLVRRLTGARYRRMELDDTTRKLRVHTDGPGPVDVGPPMSRGTLDQIYFALRIGLVEHLDAGHEQLPLFLDEVFVNWDESRRKVGADILAELSTERQVIVFTCHQWLADELRDRAGASLLQIGSAPSHAEFSTN